MSSISNFTCFPFTHLHIPLDNQVSDFSELVAILNTSTNKMCCLFRVVNTEVIPACCWYDPFLQLLLEELFLTNNDQILNTMLLICNSVYNPNFRYVPVVLVKTGNHWGCK